MITPRWLDTRSQPVAVSDVVGTLADLAEREDAPRELRQGGAEVLTHRDMIRRTAAVLGRRSPIVIRVPLLTPRLNATRERTVADAVIRDPEEHTAFDEHGAVHSIQAADLTMPEAALDAIWSPTHLERLARTYWKYLSRVTLGLIRVAYTPTERQVVLITRPFVLLRFRAPEYAMDDERGVVRWRIRDGILVASEGHEGDGYLEIDIRRCPEPVPGRAMLHVEVEIASFYPAIAFRIARWVYANTQSRIHVLVTHGFLRSLAKLELEESAVGRFATPQGAPPARPVTVGDTPWRVVGALAAAAATVLALLARGRR